MDRKAVENFSASSSGVVHDICESLLTAWDVIEHVESSCSAEGICCGWSGRKDVGPGMEWHHPDCKLAAVLAQARGTTIDIHETSEEID